MNETLPTRKLSPTEVFVGEVLNPDRRRDVLRALPRGIDVDRFEQSLSIAIMQNPKLLQVHPGLVFREVVKASSLGLFLDPQLGEAYLVIVRNNRAGRDEPQLRIGYRGLMKLARQSGEIAQIYAHCVYARDIFKIAYGLEFTLIHEPHLPPADVTDPGDLDPGPVRGVYAVVKYKSGDFDFEFMPQREVDKVRDGSDGWRAYKAGRIKSTPWSEWPTEMARKTAIRRLLKRTPQSPDLLKATLMVDREEDGEFEGVDSLHISKRKARADEALRAIANGNSGGKTVDVPETDEIERPRRRRRGRPRKERGEPVQESEAEIEVEASDPVETTTPPRKPQPAEPVETDDDLDDADEYEDDGDDDESDEEVAYDPDTGEIEAEPKPEPARASPRAQARTNDRPAETVRSAPVATPKIDKTGDAYLRGFKDYEKGLTKCLSTPIRNDAKSFAEWEAGQRDAQAEGRH